MIDLEKIPELAQVQQEPQRVLGNNLLYSPQPKLTAPYAIDAGGSYDFDARSSINANKTRILEIENALVKLGLLNKR